MNATKAQLNSFSYNLAAWAVDQWESKERQEAAHKLVATVGLLGAGIGIPNRQRRLEKALGGFPRPSPDDDIDLELAIPIGDRVWLSATSELVALPAPSSILNDFPPGFPVYHCLNPGHWKSPAVSDGVGGLMGRVAPGSREELRAYPCLNARPALFRKGDWDDSPSHLFWSLTTPRVEPDSLVQGRTYSLFVAGGSRLGNQDALWLPALFVGHFPTSIGQRFGFDVGNNEILTGYFPKVRPHPIEG